MREKKGRDGQDRGGKRDKRAAGFALDAYCTSDTLRRQEVEKYPPGWLIARLMTPPPASPITRSQGKYLLNLIQQVGLGAYRGYKARLGIPLDLPLPRLTKGKAWQLINAIVTDLEVAE